MRQLSFKWKQRGTALISAIFITAIAAMLAVAIVVQQHLLIHLSILSDNTAQGYFDLEGVMLQARGDFVRYTTAWLAKSQNENMLRMPAHIGPKVFEGVTLNAYLQDQQALFNINDLGNTTMQNRFIRLLQAVDPNIGTQQALSISQAISAWIVPGNNASDDGYASQHPPYRAAHQPMLDVSELRDVAGITPDIYQRLQPYITALPLVTRGTPININTAPAAVMLTLSPSLDLNKAQALIACRNKNGMFVSTAAFNARCVQPLGLAPLQNITTHSQYYLVRASALRRDQSVFLTRLLVTQRDKNNRIVARVAWQMLH